MGPEEIFKIMLLLMLVACAVGAALSRKLLTSVIIFMSYSGIMAIVWATLRAPDLAITEAAVGAGVSAVLFFICLKRIGGTGRSESAPAEDETPDKPGEGASERPETPGDGAEKEDGR